MKTNVKLVKKEVIAKDTIAFYFQKPKGFEFRAGQFADYTLIDPPQTDEEGNIRGFSLANAPFEEHLVAATRMRDTAFKRVIKDLPIGSQLLLDAPYGDFTLHKTDTRAAVFLIGGIGVTPVRSMVVQALHDKTAHQMILLHASNTPEDLPFVDDFRQLAAASKNFSYVPVVSSSAPTDWPGEQGRIDRPMVEKYIDGLVPPIYYLAGPEGMVKAMRSLLMQIGVNEDDIRTEEFTGY